MAGEFWGATPSIPIEAPRNSCCSRRQPLVACREYPRQARRIGEVVDAGHEDFVHFGRRWRTPAPVFFVEFPDRFQEGAVRRFVHFGGRLAALMIAAMYCNDS